MLGSERMLALPRSCSASMVATIVPSSIVRSSKSSESPVLSGLSGAPLNDPGRNWERNPRKNALGLSVPGWPVDASPPPRSKNQETPYSRLESSVTSTTFALMWTCASGTSNRSRNSSTMSL